MPKIENLNVQGVYPAENLAKLKDTMLSLYDNELVCLPPLSSTPAIQASLSKPRPMEDWLKSFPPEDGYGWSITLENGATHRPKTIKHASTLLSSTFKAALFFNSFQQLEPTSFYNYSASMEQLANIRERAEGKECCADLLIDDLVSISQPDAFILFEKFVFLSICDNDHSLNLTPKVHTDRDYGPFESAIVSFSSATETRIGTVVYPHARVTGDIELSDWLASDEFGELARSSTPYAAANGEFLIFSGRQGLYEDSAVSRGLPHISPKLAVGDFRLVLLCRICYDVSQ